MGTEKRVGLELLLRVKKSGRRYYVTLPGDVAGNYRLAPGDLLRVELKTLTRKSEEAGD